MNSILTGLTDNQRKIIVRLPYRAGLYVSRCDDSGGDDADENELRTLENLIYGFADGVFGSELIQHIMTQTLAERDQWSTWHDDIDQVPAECEDALSILSAHVDYKERHAFAMRIMNIGEAVALAFREYAHQLPLMQRFKLYVAYRRDTKRARVMQLPTRSFEEYLCISMAERVALQKMARALGSDYV